jgi:hypothetical protein
VVTRLILLMILGFVAALYFPDSRQAMYNRALPVLEPMLIWDAEREIEQISRVVRREARETYELPETRSWTSWMTVNFSANATSDPWGKQYYYQAWPDSFHIRSDGPDRMHGSDDDIGVTKHKPF